MASHSAATWKNSIHGKMKLLFELLLATWLFGLAQSSSSAGSRTVRTGGRGSIPPLDCGRIISNPVATKGILLLIVLPDFQTFYRLWKVCTRNRYCYLLTHNILTKFSEDICHWLVAIQTFSFSNLTYQNTVRFQWKSKTSTLIKVTVVAYCNHFFITLFPF